jgi:hypothetical protein
MNELNMNEELEIVNRRVQRMLDANEVTSEVFFRDVRTLSELIEYILENEDTEGI